MTSLQDVQYKPIRANRKVYDELYALYRRLHDSFGGRDRSADLSGVMKDLLAIKDRAAGSV
jgi:L-ribulokinase